MEPSAINKLINKGNIQQNVLIMSSLFRRIIFIQGLLAVLPSEEAEADRRYKEFS
jgi:hypothetical protein